MKRFQFRQQKLLRLKQQKKQQAQMDVARLNVALSDCEKRIASVMNEVDSIQVGTGNAAIASTVSMFDVISSSQERVKQLKEDLTRYETQRRIALHSLRQISREVKTLETLRENQYSAFRSELDAKQQREADEFAQHQHARKFRLADREETDG